MNRLEYREYSATRKAKGKRQKAKVYYNSLSACINVLTLMRSAIVGRTS
ncbi:MAG: hypothetical protein F6J90_15505 [Moorea sp. SIOASIH]|nr:hypothetical protein [Moorena sp. SIOASIH]NEO37659.1 hypothetical protein [Moorena sp. SIOASIH]